MYLPLRSGSDPLGIFIYKPEDPRRKLLPDEENIFKAALQQLGGAVGA
jgi:hypothetical protein